MFLQYYVTESATGNRVNIEIDAATQADLDIVFSPMSDETMSWLDDLFSTCKRFGHAAGFGTGTLSKPPIFRTKGAKSWPVLPLRRRDFWIILLTCILFCIFLFSRAKGGILTNYLFQFSRILAFCFLGEICHAVLPLPLPASIYGLLLLLAALRFGIVKLEQVKEVGLFLTGIFPLLFVPAAAGVMELWAEMGEMLLPIVIAIIPVTVLVLVSAGRTTQALTSRRAAKKEAEHD